MAKSQSEQLFDWWKEELRSASIKKVDTLPWLLRDAAIALSEYDRLAEELFDAAFAIWKRSLRRRDEHHSMDTHPVVAALTLLVTFGTWVLLPLGILARLLWWEP